MSCVFVPVNSCDRDSCGISSARCVALHRNFYCLCQYGFYYSNKDCHKGKMFPGFITLNVPYSDRVQVVDSMEYEQVFVNVTEFFESAFKESDFGQTVIVKIEALTEGRSSLTTGIMNVTVINLFKENSTETNETVYSAIIPAINSTNYVSEYRVATFCAAFNCDAQTTDCVESTFPECVCKDSFSKTEWDVRSCSDCSNCSANANKFCEKENGIPTCKCMPNFLMESDTCVPCPVGYAGVDCNNNRELILIIVGTVFGAIILALAIAVTVVSVRAKTKQDPEKKRLIKSGYSNPSASDERQTTMFPRVKTTSGHANPGYQPNNPYAMHSPDRGRFSERDDDLYGISREPEGFRLQNRY
ncbi:mucin-13 [Phaenicophaeus curvirostris]|uniref:mucin-13 n=1 Tax=Phaenicophaeus curvirostris TaxID=33595 RepID=UPI0037F09E9E